jgi:hypothetical protein
VCCGVAAAGENSVVSFKIVPPSGQSGDFKFDAESYALSFKHVPVILFQFKSMDRVKAKAVSPDFTVFVVFCVCGAPHAPT